MDNSIEQDVVNLSKELMRAPSVTPADEGCQEILAGRLRPLGFSIEYLNAGDVTNLWASYAPSFKADEDKQPHLLFAGHTDVVPTGPGEAWDHPPFEPMVQDGYLCGRGAADMKSSLAAMIVATERTFARQKPQGRLSFLITSDEEGDALHGTRHAIAELLKRDIRPDYCVVGEPSSSHKVGDVVRCGRRGSLNGHLTVNGVQGHVAYPLEATNPIHTALGILDELARTEWDAGNAYYPPTSFQISNMNSGTGATNVIPGNMQVLFNFRFSTEQTAAALVARVERMLTAAGLDYHLKWKLSGEPFLTQQGRLTDCVHGAVKAVMDIVPEMSTSGGTSDGRFIAPWHGRVPTIDTPDTTDTPLGPPVETVELGPTNATIHKVNERIPLSELNPLAQIYARLITGLLN